MIFRISKTQDYTVMSNYHLRDRNLSLKAKGLLSWMLSNDDNWDYSISGIVACCKEGETSITSTLKELQENGYIVVTKMNPNTENNRIHYIYDVYEKPLSQDPGFQPLENQPVENQVQINTNKINTNKIKNSKELEDFESSNSDFLGSVKKEKKPSLYSKCVSMIDDFCIKNNQMKLRNLLVNYLNMRLEAKDIQYTNQWKGLLNKLVTIESDWEAVIQQSLDRGYRSFFPVSEYKSNNLKHQPWEENVRCSTYTEEEWQKQLEWQEQMKAEGKRIEF